MHVTGPGGFSADLTEAFSGIDGILPLVALIAVFVILVIVYRSPLLPVIVLLTSVAGLSASIFVVWHLADAEVLTINGEVQGILFILVIGATTDYSLLVVARFRDALLTERDRVRAGLEALTGVFEPIAASGGTVVASLLVLLLTDLASTRALGPVAAIGIGLAMIAALTFLPWALMTIGRAVFWPFAPKLRAEGSAMRKGLWARTAEVVVAQDELTDAAKAIGHLGGVESMAVTANDAPSGTVPVNKDSDLQASAAAQGSHSPQGLPSTPSLRSAMPSTTSTLVPWSAGRPRSASTRTPPPRRTGPWRFRSSSSS